MSLMDWYLINFELKEYRDGGVWSLDEIYSLIPFEREIYIALTKQRVQDRKEMADNG